MIQTVRGETYAKFAREVKATTWLVFGLVTGYNVLAFLDNFYWMSESFSGPYSRGDTESTSIFDLLFTPESYD